MHFRCLIFLDFKILNISKKNTEDCVFLRFTKHTL